MSQRTNYCFGVYYIESDYGFSIACECNRKDCIRRQVPEDVFSEDIEVLDAEECMNQGEKYYMKGGPND